jgi:hypothetical protein
MPNHRQKAPQDVYLVARQGQGIHLESLERPTLSIWQSAVLAYASAKCGIKFTSIEHTDRWLRTNPQNPQHLTVKAVFGLLLVEPPKKRRKSLPSALARIYPPLLSKTDPGILT